MMDFEKPTVVTNADLYERMNDLERKVDVIFQRMEQATGAWTFVKIIGAMGMGLAVMWNAISDYFRA